MFELVTLRPRSTKEEVVRLDLGDGWPAAFNTYLLLRGYGPRNRSLRRLVRYPFSRVFSGRAGKPTSAEEKWAVAALRAEADAIRACIHKPVADGGLGIPTDRWSYYRWDSAWEGRFGPPDACCAMTGFDYKAFNAGAYRRPRRRKAPPAGEGR